MSQDSNPKAQVHSIPLHCLSLQIPQNQEKPRKSSCLSPLWLSHPTHQWRPVWPAGSAAGWCACRRAGFHTCGRHCWPARWRWVRWHSEGWRPGSRNSTDSLPRCTRAPVWGPQSTWAPRRSYSTWKARHYAISGHPPMAVGKAEQAIGQVRNCAGQQLPLFLLCVTLYRDHKPIYLQGLHR